MMKIENSFKAIFASMMIVSGLVACDKPGTAEKAGKKIDQAAENVSTATSNTADKANQVLTEKSKETGKAMDDTEITAKVKAALLNEPGLQSMKVTVVTVNNVVTLTGSANTKENKEKIGDLAGAVSGVKSVTNKLTIAK
jgi:osmotically-inducible protein OsmY